MPNFYQQLTIFKDDTTTVDGVVIAGPSSGITAVQATCSTDPTHARPFLNTVLEGVNREVNMVEGKASIGALNITLQDNRRLASQDTGWFTQLLADAGGKNQLVGQRIVLQQFDPWSGLKVVFDGLMDDFILSETKTVYTITTRDMRDRERPLRLFYRAETSIIWPYDDVERNGIFGPGIAGGYGRLNPNDPASTKLIPDGKGVKGIFRKNTVDANAATGVIEFYNKPEAQASPIDDFTPRFEQYNLTSEDAAAGGTHATAQGSALETLFNTGLTVQWRAWGTADPWKTMRYMPWWRLKDAGGVIHSLGYADKSGPPGFTVSVSAVRSGVRGPATTTYTIGGVGIASTTLADLPANNQDVEVRVLSGMPPSDRAPLHLELPFGTFLKNAYDGIYSSTPSNIRYANIDETGPLLRAIITGSVEDGQGWLAENWYKPLGMFPRINENGEIEPIKWSLPDASVSLPVLDQNNLVVEKCGWQHTSNDAITKVEFSYFRDFVGVDKVLHSIQVIMDEIDAPGGTRVGDKPVTYAPVTIRDITTDPKGGYGQAVKAAELGAQLFGERVNDVLDRWSLGGQRIPLVGIRSNAVVRALKEGDWVSLQVPALPDYVTGLRGMNRVAQVVSIQDHNPVERYFTVIDGGPASAPLATPNITAVVADPYGRLTVTVAGVPAGADARVDHVVAAAAPAANDRRWNYIGRRTGIGNVLSPRVPAGNSYVRVRAEQPGRRPSNWSGNTNYTVPQTYAVLNPIMILNDDGTVSLIWTPLAAVPGIRLYYQMIAPGGVPTNPLPFVADVNGSLGIYTLPALPPGYTLYLDVEGWSGFAAGAVTGTQGLRDHLDSVARLADQTIPAIDVQMVANDNTAVTYRVLSADASLTLYYAFGNDPFPGVSNLDLGDDLIVPRDQNGAPSRLLRIRAVDTNGGEIVVPIIVDWDIIPGLYVATDRTPIFSGPAQVGWRLRGTVDDDTRALMVAVTGTLAISQVTPAGVTAAGVYWADTSVTKNWTIDLLQAVGELGTVSLTPREFYNTADGGLAGPQVDIKLERPAIITHVVREMSATQRDVTLSVNPATAKIVYRLDGGAWVERSGGVTTFSIDVGGAARVIEYYSVTANGTISDTVRLVIDQDSRPSITSFILSEVVANKLRLVVGLDDDVVKWVLWARRDAWPTIDGTLATVPDTQFKRYDGGTERTTVDWQASGNGDGTSDWYVIARAYDDVGDFDQYPDPNISGEVTAASIVVSGAPAAVGALSSLAAYYSGGFNIVDWNHNATVEAGGHTVTVRENGTQLVTGRDAKLEPSGSSATANYGGYRTAKSGVSPGTPGAVFLTFNYEVDLRRTSDNALLGTYTTSLSGWYAGGGGGGGAPSEVPNNLSITFPNDPSTPRANWDNTNMVASLHIAWYSASTSGGSYTLDDEYDLPANSINHDYPSPRRAWVKFKVRYYNSSGDGAYSALSAPGHVT